VNGPTNLQKEEHQHVKQRSTQRTAPSNPNACLC
jgi:hypothetical protein